MSPLEVVCAALILVGIAGVVIPVLPGGLLVLGSILLWAAVEGTPRAWTVVAVSTGFVVVGAVVKYAVPGRRLDRAGIPRSTVVAGAVLGVVGFFVVPVVGLPLGFVLGVYAAELRRVDAASAWPATKRALAAVGISMLIELLATLLASATWLTGVLTA